MKLALIPCFLKKARMGSRTPLAASCAEQTKFITELIEEGVLALIAGDG